MLRPELVFDVDNFVGDFLERLCDFVYKLPVHGEVVVWRTLEISCMASENGELTVIITISCEDLLAPFRSISKGYQFTGCSFCGIYDKFMANLDQKMCPNCQF